jgi:hypothetical protein
MAPRPHSGLAVLVPDTVEGHANTSMFGHVREKSATMLFPEIDS